MCVIYFQTYNQVKTQAVPKKKQIEFKMVFGILDKDETDI